jgi:hypothetical protein
MPRTLDDGFRDFLAGLTPSETESNAAKSHRGTIEQCLRASFGLQRFFRIGSFGNGTSISGYSDVDYLACLPRSALTQNSTSTLAKVRTVLDARFPLTGVTVRTPAVVLPFGNYVSEQTEVVPADQVEAKGFPVYEIADGAGGWMRTSPDAHNEYVRAVNERLAGKAKPLIRLLKAWKYLCNVPISSFYLELRAGKYATGERAIVYYLDLKAILTQLLNAGLAQMQDPMGVSGYIAACSSDPAYKDAMSKLTTAVTRAEKAVDAIHARRISDAFDWLKLLFGGAFPSYYY